MHLYWMIMEELKYMKEVWVMTDPGLKRCYKKWSEKHLKAISCDYSSRIDADSNGIFSYKGIKHSLN